MKPALLGAGFLLLFNNEILSLLAILLVGVAFIITIMKSRIDK